MTKKEMRKIIWQKTMLLTIEMQHKKSQFLKGKYAAYKEMWEELGGDKVINEEEEEDDRVRFKMDKEGNLTRI